MSNDVDMTLAERGARYGDFEGHAQITQELKATMHASPNWSLLKPDQKEALEMAAHKIGRILNGDPNYIDSWHDIIGYTRLVENRLTEDEKILSDKQSNIDWPELDAGVVSMGVDSSVAVSTDGTIRAFEPVIGSGVKGGASQSVVGLEESLVEQAAADAKRKADADAKRKAAAEKCACPSCTLRRALQAALPGVQVEIHRLF